MIFSRIPKNTYAIAVACALVAAVCTALKTPLTKLVVEQCDAVSASAFLHLGMLIGMSIIAVCGRKTSLMNAEKHLRKKDTPYLIIIILAGTAAALLVNYGLLTTTAATGAVLNNFTLVVTALLAFFVFKEKISKRLWIAITFITLGVMILSIGDITAFSLTPGALFIVGGTLCYGFSNNIMKKVSGRNPVETSIVKAFGVTLLSFILMPVFGAAIPSFTAIIFMMIIGFLTSGLGFLFTLYAQRELGAAKTGAISGIYPLLGIVASIIIFADIPTLAFGAALLLIIPGLFFAITRNKKVEVEDDEKIPQAAAESCLFTGMSENTKRDTRNYITAFGFLAIALFFIHLLLEAYTFLDSGIIPVSEVLIFNQEIVIGSFLLICAILLFILRKRALTASTFMFISILVFADNLLPPDPLVIGVFCAFAFVFAAILLLSKEKVKYAYAGISAAFGLASLSSILLENGVLGIISGIIMILFTIFIIYVIIACSANKYSLPLTKYLIRDEETSIRTSGRMIGYLIIALTVTLDVIYEIINIEMLNYEILLPIRFTLALMLLLSGVLLLFIGKQRFTPMLFIGIAFMFWLDSISVGYFYYMAVFGLLIIGILAVVRKSTRLLPSLLTIFYSFALMIYAFYSQGWVVLKTAAILLGIACALLSIYLACATSSEVKKLPLF